MIIFRASFKLARVQYYQMRHMAKTAGILVIGDEILKGQTLDTNSHYLSELLHSAGIHVKRVCVIGDVIEEIAAEIRLFSQKFDYVLTSGGIGPTHDDVTLEAAAQAFQEKVFPHPTLLQLCKQHFGEKSLDSPEMKMAHVPESALLHFGFDTATGRKFKFPLISVKNVYLFPGIPTLLERTATNLKHLFKGGGKFYTEQLLINEFETNVAPVLSECYSRFSVRGVSIGSYPDWINNYYKVKIVIESMSEETTDSALNFLMDSIPKQSVVQNYTLDPVSLRGEDVYNSSNFSPALQNKVAQAIEIIEEALERYNYSSICIGFNGGKDCTALLHLYYAVLCRKLPDAKVQIQGLYVKDPHPFEEVDGFMENSRKRYNLNLFSLEDKMKPALEMLKSEKPEIQAVLMGTRYTDPYSRNLNPFTPTDADWPSFMRVNPMLKWSYRDIWEFLRSLCLPYCILYDRGYTSLGSRKNTKPNEKLMYLDENSQVRYKPAYTLENAELERNGRL